MGDGKRSFTKAYMLFLTAGRVAFRGKKPLSPFALLGTKYSTPSNMSSPGVWNTGHWPRSTP
jgi:hypothetical protein